MFILISFLKNWNKCICCFFKNDLIGEKIRKNSDFFFFFFVKIYGEQLTSSLIWQFWNIFLLYTIIFAYKKMRKILNLQILLWKSQDTLNKAIVVSTDSIYHPIELKKNCPLWNSLSQTISQPNFFSWWSWHHKKNFEPTWLYFFLKRVPLCTMKPKFLQSCISILLDFLRFFWMNFEKKAFEIWMCKAKLI